MLLLVCSAAATFDATEATRRFDLPAAPAEVALKRFSQQSGHGVIFSTAAVAGITTNPVRGQFTPRAAIEELVARTGLAVRFDERSGAFSIAAAPSSAPAHRGADASAPSPSPAKKSP